MIPEDEKRRVQADGYILCHQCGHRVDDHDEDGCHLTVLCDCDLEYTYDEVSLLYRHYELFPYSLGAQVRYYDSPGDTGTVVGVGLKSDTDITVDVQWDADRETQIIWDPRRELMPVERP